MSDPRPRRRPVLLYDGDCGFCTRSVEFARRFLPADVDLLPWQAVDLRTFGVTREQAEYEIVWIPSGVDSVEPVPMARRAAHRHGRSGGAQAVAAYLIHRGGPAAVLGWCARIPPVRWLAHLAYRLVANNRYRLPGGSPACSLPPEDRSDVSARQP